MKVPAWVAIFLGMFSAEAFAQEYHPFPEEDARWTIYLESTCDNDRPPDPFLLRYSLCGDTLIHEVQYHKLCRERLYGGSPDTVPEPVGGIREEEKKIYYFGPGFLGSETGQEVLLYDFSAGPGDTIVHTPDGFFRSVVLETDSLWISDGYRKSYLVDNGWFYHNPDSIVEGIGSILNGLLGHISDIPTCGTHYWEHVCFMEKGMVLHRNPAFPDCNTGLLPDAIPDGTVEAYPAFRIYPNPGSGIVQVETGTAGKVRITVSDLAGRLLHACDMEGPNGQVDLSSLGEGLYLIRLTPGNNLFSGICILYKKE